MTSTLITWLRDPAHIALLLMVVGPSVARLGTKTGWKWCTQVSVVLNELGTDLLALLSHTKPPVT